VKAYRLVKASYAAGALSFESARHYGGRWNSKGTRVAYLSDSPALAALEILVHTSSEGDLQDYLLIEVGFDQALVETLDAAALPEGWDAPKPSPQSQVVGDRWVAEERSLLLRLPSAVIPKQSNFLLNPQHPDMARLAIGESEPFRFDPRLARSPKGGVHGHPYPDNG